MMGNLIQSIANVVVTRNNVIQAFHRYYVEYNVITSTYTTPLVPLGGGLNTTRFTQGAAVKSATYLNVPITYQDTDGTTTVPITSAIVLSGQTGNTGPQGNRGFLPMAYVVTPATPVGASQVNLTTWFSAPRTANTAPIGTGYTPITGDTAVFTYAGGPGQPSATYTYNASNVWATANAQVIDGNVIVNGTITSNKINVNDVFAINIQSTNANIGNINSAGYWLQANTGNARFGGNVFIGNTATIGANLIVGDNASIGSNLAVSGLITAGALNVNTVNTQNIVPQAVTGFLDFQNNGPLTIVSGSVVPGTWYYYNNTPFQQITTVQNNQTVFLWSQGSFVWEFSGTGGPAGTTQPITVTAEIVRYQTPGFLNLATVTTASRTTTGRVDLPNQSVSADPPPINGIVDVVPTAGTWLYGWRVRWTTTASPNPFVFSRVRLFGVTTPTTTTFLPINMLALGLKR